jgi:hypothetical protein
MKGYEMAKSKKHKCLAEGEVTGHAHRVAARNAWVVGDGEERLLTAPNGTDVTHEEHKTVTIPPGDYQITRQREIDPDTEEARVVAD